jgi:hypothetical protein
MIDWNLAQRPGGFENALAQGLQFGSQLAERRQQEEQRNALSAYAIDPGNEKNFNALAQVAPEYAIQVRGQRDAAAQRQAQSGAEGIAQFRPVLEQVQANPAMWPQARQAAIQSGIDASRIPEAYDPNWVSGQLLFVRSAEDGSLPSIARELQVAGIDVETPEGQQVLRQVIEGRYASEYTDAEGNVRRRRLFNLPPVSGQQAQAPQQVGGVPSGSPLSQPVPVQAPQPGAIEDGYRFRGGNPADPNSWEPVSQQMNAPAAPQGQPETLTRQEVQSLVQQYGQETISRLMQAGRIVVGN